MGRSRFLLFLALAAWPVSLHALPLPWKEGETLDYRITWGAVLAAEAQFTAHQVTPNRWRFALDLQSRGVVESFSPIRDRIYSLTDLAPWRSVEYGEDRSEGGAERKNVTRIDYTAHAGHFRDLEEGRGKSFPIPADALDDLGSMLYGLRRGDWKPGVVRPIHAYDGPQLHRGEAVFLRREMLDAEGFDHPVPCLVIRLHPIYDDPAKNARGYYALLWLRDDAGRIPLRADLKARFGTFTLQLVPNS
jgi:hypothetical protein